MTVRRALIRDGADGRVKELPVGDTLAGASGGGGGNSTRVEVSFGVGSNYVEATVPATWVTTTSRIVCSPAPPSTTDHDPEDALLEGITAAVLLITNGVSFKIGVSAPDGTWGRYNIDCIGV
jgi:hypothetical protein